MAFPDNRFPEQKDHRDRVGFCGGLFTAYGPLAHWIYAEKGNGNLKFFDYQTDKAETAGSAPAESSEPMKDGGAPIPGKYQMIVVAFCPDVGKPLTGRL